MSNSDDVLAKFPGPITLYQSKRSAVLLRAQPLILIIFLGAVATIKGRPLWVLVPALLVTLPCIFVLKRGSLALTLSKDGFETYIQGSIRTSLWKTVSGIQAVRTPTLQRRVVFNDSVWNGGLARWSTSTLGYNGFLIDNYGMSSPDELAALMKAWQEQALSAPEKPL